MPACPAGHDSESSDFCSKCGTPLGIRAGAQLTATADPPGEPCQRCGTASSGHFCETCGFDFVNGTNGVKPPASGPVTAAAYSPGSRAAAGDAEPSNGSASERASLGAWAAVVSADWLYYESVITTGGHDAAALPFPGYCTERRFWLTGPQMRIGRRSVSRGVEPEIDLTGPPTDPGVSRLHAVLIAGQEGGWAVLDPGSENGTLVNDKAIATGVPVALADGDRIHLGLWTMIVIQVPVSASPDLSA
jgi:FHA domain-containing protein